MGRRNSSIASQIPAAMPICHGFKRHKEIDRFDGTNSSHIHKAL